MITLSSTEAEYIAANLAVQEAIWLRSLLNDLCKDPKFHSRTKNIDIKYHFIREKIKDSEIDCRCFDKTVGKDKVSKIQRLDGSIKLYLNICLLLTLTS